MVKLEVRFSYGTCLLLGMLFVAFKLAEVISWPWWLVLLPIWGPVALIMAVAIVVVMFLAIFGED